MFKFSGKLSISEWWGQILLNLLIMIVIGFIGGAIQNTAQPRSYGEPNGGLLFFALIFWLINLAFYIRGMGITARRLRDAGYNHEQIVAYYWLILIPIVSAVAMIAYFFIAGFSPSKISDEERATEELKQAEEQTKADAEQKRHYEEAYRRGQADAWAREDETKDYTSSDNTGNNAYNDQAKKWAEEETEAEQKNILLPKR